MRMALWLAPDWSAPISPQGKSIFRTRPLWCWWFGVSLSLTIWLDHQPTHQVNYHKLHRRICDKSITVTFEITTCIYILLRNIIRRNEYCDLLFIVNGQTPRCCDQNGQHLPSNQLHTFCLPINIPENDAFYKDFNRTCMQFVRSNIGGNYQCTFDHAEQVYFKHTHIRTHPYIYIYIYTNNLHTCINIFSWILLRIGWMVLPFTGALQNN